VLIRKDAAFVDAEAHRAVDIRDDRSVCADLLHHSCLAAGPVVALPHIVRGVYLCHLGTGAILSARARYYLGLIGSAGLTHEAKGFSEKTVEHWPAATAAFYHKVTLEQMLGRKLLLPSSLDLVPALRYSDE